KIAVRAEIRAVDVIGATGQRATFEPFFPLVRHAVSVRVGELPDARRPGDVNRTFIPEAALREHHLVRVFDRFVESSVAIAVFDTDDARSEERRVGKECRAWWWPYDEIK